MVFALDQYQMRLRWVGSVASECSVTQAGTGRCARERRTFRNKNCSIHMDVSERKLLICLFPVQTNLYAMGVLAILEHKLHNFFFFTFSEENKKWCLPVENSPAC